MQDCWRHIVLTLLVNEPYIRITQRERPRAITMEPEGKPFEEDRRGLKTNFSSSKASKTHISYLLDTKDNRFVLLKKCFCGHGGYRYLQACTFDNNAVSPISVGKLKRRRKKTVRV